MTLDAQPVPNLPAKIVESSVYGKTKERFKTYSIHSSGNSAAPSCARPFGISAVDLAAKLAGRHSAHKTTRDRVIQGLPLGFGREAVAARDVSAGLCQESS